MHEPLLARAARPAPTIVLGLLMRPFSIGHQLLLIREANPLAESNDASALKVAEAALICSQNWSENASMPFDHLSGLKFWLWGKRGPVRRFRKDATVQARELLAFVRYRDEGTLELPLSDWPRPAAQQRSGGRPPGSPYLLRLQQFLMASFHLSEIEAWDYPLGLAKMRWQAFWEEQDALDVHNYLDAQRDAVLAEQEAKGREICQAS